MTEHIDSHTHDDNNDESESLRKTLEQMRKEAEEEVERLSTKLSEREFAPDSSIATATERLAMQQEMTMLQQTLEVKEQALDQITQECRRLEDELEDQNMAFDGLKQEVERKESALKTARIEAERLRQELLEAKRFSEGRSVQPVEPTITQEQPRLPEQPRIPASVLIAGGAVLFILLSLAMLLLIYTLWTRGALPLSDIQLPTGWTLVAPPDDAPATESPTAAEAVTPVIASAATPTAHPLRIHQDRLRSGGLGPSMVVLKGGLFRMGHNSLSGEDFSPAHDVRVAPFMIGAHEVTFQEYDRFASATGRAPANDYGWGRGTRPVVGVSWDDARAYANWLSEQTRSAYRLPTEAEWEFAARAGTQSSFWWGFSIEPERATCFDCGTRWDNRSTAPVKRFAPNPYGLYDTAGNAMEWVLDCYEAGYQDAPNDGSARLDGACMTRVARGGAFNKPSASMRTYVRARFVPDTQLNMLGFRVARDS